MDKNKALQKLLNGTATKEEIESLKQALASGELSIGGDVSRSVVIIGSGNKVELTAEALSLLKPEAAGEAPAEGDSPYMGLKYFDAADSELFFGRAALTRELAERIAGDNFLAIIGASGSGKSSVARAGLIPAWKKENERGLVHVITPTAQPLESLAASLTRESESVTATSTLMDDLTRDSRSLWLYIRKMLDKTGKTNLLLVVDQFEETFTLCKDPAARKAFIENLISLAGENNDAARVVLTLRADFYHHCAEYEGLRLMLEKHQAFIGAMTQDELREAIVQPAERNGWDFQPGLVDLILQDVGTEPGALPLLSHALLETWKRRQGRTLTLQGYHDAGGVKKAITQTAETVYRKLLPSEQIAARNIFLRLTELGEGTQDTRRRANLDELGTEDTVRKVIKTLADARLLTTEQDSAEVAHEALIREWGTLRKWLDEDRESLRLHRDITESAAEWERAGREEAYLIHRSGRLDDALALRENTLFGLSASEEEYLKACVGLRSKEKRERERRSRLILVSSIAVAVIFLFLGSFGLIKSREATARANDALTAQANANEQAEVANAAQAEAEKQAQIALARQLASQAQSINATRNSKQMTASLLAIQSLKLFANGDAARVWNAATGEEIARMTHDDDVFPVAFSPDGKFVVSGSDDNTARVWNAATGEEIARMTHDGIVASVAFSPDTPSGTGGKFVVSGSADNTARVWNAATGEEIARITHDNVVYSVAFSPDGKFVVSGSEDGTARVWNAATGEEIARMTHDDRVRSVAFSPDTPSGTGGKFVVSGSWDNTARVWNAATGEEIARMTHDDIVTSVAFSPDGKFVVSGSADNTARVWDASTGEEIARLNHDDIVTSVTFSPDTPSGTGGKFVVSGSYDTTVRIWAWQSKDLIANACAVMPRNLTRAEWDQFIGDALPYQAVCENLSIEP